MMTTERLYSLDKTAGAQEGYTIDTHDKVIVASGSQLFW